MHRTESQKHGCNQRVASAQYRAHPGVKKPHRSSTGQCAGHSHPQITFADEPEQIHDQRMQGAVNVVEEQRPDGVRGLGRGGDHSEDLIDPQTLVTEIEEA